MAELIVALDLPTREAALAMADRVSAAGVSWFKIGSVLFTAAGPGLVRELAGRGHRIFLDLKWHDIPNTVAGAVRSAADLGVAMATVHTLGGVAMMAAAREAAGSALAVVGVTVLTSHSREAWAEVVGSSGATLGSEVARLAAGAARAGLAGVVSSPHETAALRASLGPDALLVTPGIRAAGDAAGDQVRTATAAVAVEAGSTHLVVGRPILGAADPAAACRSLLAEIR